MGKLRLDDAISRLPLGDYRGKMVALAAFGAAAPFGALIAGRGTPSPLEIGLAAAGALGSLAALRSALKPVALTAAALRACASGNEAPELPAGRPGEAGRMMDDVRLVAGKLEGLRHRLNNRHPISGLPTREPLLAAVAEAGSDAAGTVLGMVRFTDYARLAAFDQEAANRALSAFARRLRAAVSAQRPLAQVDRDCFAVWFRDAPDQDAAAAELQAVGYALGEELVEGDLHLAPEVSLGAAIFPPDPVQPASVLTQAFAALPKSRDAVVGKPAFFTAESSTAARARFSLEQDLRRAVSRDEFMLHFQPVVDLSVGAVVGAEALLRWNHPQRGLVSPGEFIPVLEQSGLMDEVGLWVLNTASRQARAWEDEGLTGLTMAVNLSARQFRDPGLNEIILRTLERRRLAPGALELELTETAAMEDAQHSRRLFGELRAMGVGVAIDDFGTGYSSLSYLKNLPFSKLKIDREFVANLDERRDSHAICSALVELCHGLGISVVAEGVETGAELESLLGLGCEMFQGFFFARPMAAADFVRTATDPDWLATLASPARREMAELRRRVRA